MDYRVLLALGAIVLLACADSPMTTAPAMGAAAEVPAAEQLASLPPSPDQASVRTGSPFPPTVAIADAADRLATVIENRAHRSALQGYLRGVEAYWLAGQPSLATEAIKSSRQVLTRIAALQKGCVELDAIELALQDAANAFATR